MNWRLLLINPLLIACVAGTGVAICRATGADWHPRDLAAAVAAALLSAEAAVLLVLFRRDHSPAGAAQSALLALVAHLLLSLVLAALLLLANQVSRSFVWWAMAMFWATLLGLSAVLVRSVRGAAAEYRAGATNKQRATAADH